MDLFWQYLVIGDMPEPVARFAQDGDASAAANLQNSILDLYVSDMAKYSRNV